MAEALEECASIEVVKRDEAIEVLYKELDIVEGEKKRIAEEVVDLRMGQWVVDELKAQVETLEQEIVGSKAVEELALARMQKAKDSNDNLWKEVEA